MDPFTDLYRRHAKDVFRFALYLSGNRADAEDIASETFVRAWTASDRLRVETVKAYLLAIARNLYVEGFRREKPRGELPAELVDPAPGPAASAETRAELERVLDFLQEIPETDRAALLMSASEGLPHAEIAEALGLTVAAVKIKIHRARLRLARLRSPEETK